MGSFALWRLAARGIDAICFERFEPGHDKGSGHGESRVIRTAYFEGSTYVPLIRSAFDLWRELERETGESLLTMTGALMVGPEEGELVSGTVASAREYGLTHEVFPGDRLPERYPQHAPRPGLTAVYEEAAGVLRAEASIETAARRAEKLGATLFRYAPVESIETDASGVKVRANGRVYSARHAIVAVGSWLGKLFPSLDRHLSVERQVLAWFEAREPEAFAFDRFPVCVFQEDDVEWYAIPSLDGGPVKVALHHYGQTVDPETIDRETHPEDMARLSGYVEDKLLGLFPDPVYTKVCMYTNTPDRHFLVGQVPNQPNLTLLGGFSGHGFKFAPLMGEVAADLASEGSTTHDIAGFDPGRLAKVSDVTA